MKRIFYAFNSYCGKLPQGKFWGIKIFSDVINNKLNFV